MKIVAGCWVWHEHSLALTTSSFILRDSGLLSSGGLIRLIESLIVCLLALNSKRFGVSNKP